MAWPLSKIYEYMAYYLTLTDDFKDNFKSKLVTPEQQRNLLIEALRSSMGIK